MPLPCFCGALKSVIKPTQKQCLYLQTSRAAVLGQRVRRPLCAPQAPGALTPAGAPPGAGVPFYNPAQFAQVSVSPGSALPWEWGPGGGGWVPHQFPADAALGWG